LGIARGGVRGHEELVKIAFFATGGY